MKKKKIVCITFLVIFVGLAGFATFWVLDSSKPMEEALGALITDDMVEVGTDIWITFSPKNTTPTTAIIFYPGGKVEPESYSVLAKSIAIEGYLVIIAPMPLNLAVLGINIATEIMAEFPTIDNWIMAGHSLGGSMAAKFTYDNPTLIQGLILLAAYPTESNDLSDLIIPCLSIYGKFDTVLSQDIPSTAPLLPQTNTIHEIVGGNHAYFGYYGEQNGDGTATITREEQHEETAIQILLLLDNIEFQCKS
ncbi:MAG: alpha/beta hydrolase [Promethearchaeota archaeon]